MPTPSHRKYCAPSPTAQPRDRTHSLAWRALRDRATGNGGMPKLCILGCLPMARYRRHAFPSTHRWQDMREMRSRATGSGKISPRCVLGGLAVARFRRGAFPGVNPWQVLRSMHPESGLGRENRQFVARFARHASEMSWLWQDMRAMHPKCPANRRRRIHRAKILPGRAPFRCTNPSNHARRADLAIVRRMRGKDQAENAYVLSKLSPKDEKMSPKVLTSF